MAHISLALYRAAALVAHRVRLPTKKLSESVAGRREAHRRWLEWARSTRRPGPLIWIHGASVGELLTAEPVISRLLRDDPELTVIHTFTSASVTRWRRMALGVAASDYLPLDEPAPMGAMLEAVRPTVLAFSRGDVWPTLLTLAHSRGLPALVMGASVREGSRRLSWPARTLYRYQYSMLSWIGAASDADAARWMALGARPERVEVTGDPRHAQTLERVPEMGPIAPVAAWAEGNSVVVAGSTDRRDESLLLESAAHVLRRIPGTRLIMVPHEPEPAIVRDIVSRASRSGISAAAWEPGSEVPECSCLVVRAVGLLFELYAAGQLAYVGGGLRRRGVHAVIEPAAWGVPILAGPHARKSEDARALERAGAMRILPHRGPADALAEQWIEWSKNEDQRVAAGLRARALLAGDGARRTALVIRRFLSG